MPTRRRTSVQISDIRNLSGAEPNSTTPRESEFSRRSCFPQKPIYLQRRDSSMEEVRRLMNNILILRLKTVMIRAPRQQSKRPLEPSCFGRILGFQTQMPLPSHNGMVPSIPQQLRQRHNAVIEISFMPWLALVCRRMPHEFRQLSEASEMRVRSSHDHCTSRSAGRGDVERCETETSFIFGGERVDVRCVDFAAIAADV